MRAPSKFGHRAVTRGLDAVVKTGYDQQRQHRAGDGATDDGHRHRPVKLAAFTHTNGHRQHAGDQRKGGHQNRSQAHSAGGHQGFFTIDALFLEHPGSVEQQDGVLGHQAHQHDHANEAHQVQRASGGQQRQHHADQAQRQRHHHGQGCRKTAELHDQNQVHQRNARHQRNAHLLEHLLLVTRGTGQFQPVTRRVIHGAGDLQCVSGDLARRTPLHIGRHADGSLAVGVLNLTGALAHGDGGDLLQRHHAVAATHRNRQAFDVAGVHAVVGMQAHRDVARFTGGVDPVADLDPRKGHAQRLRRVVDGNAQRIGQAAVKFNLHLGLRVLLRQAHVHRARHLAQLGHEVVGDGQQLARVGPREADLHRLLRAVVQIVQHHVLSTHQSRRQRAQFGGDRARRALALRALAHVDVDAATAGVDVAVGGLDLGQRARQRCRRFHLQTAVLQAAAGRRAHLDRHHPGVGRGQEARAAKLTLQHERAHQAGDRKHHHPAPVVQRPRNEAAIAVGLVVEPVVEARQHFADAAFGRLVVPGRVAPIRRQHGVEREADEQAHQHRGHHCHAERPEPFTRYTWHERHRHEHRHDREGGRGHRQPDLGGATARSGDTVCTAFQVAHDVLAHHDGVVDQHADRQRQPEQAHEIERKAAQPDRNESRNHRRGQAQRRDQRRAP